MSIPLSKLPHNDSIEKNTLGLMIYSKSSCSDGLARLGDDDFYNKENKIVFNAILNLEYQRRKVDIETVTEELKNMKSLDTIGGFPYIQELIDSVISESSIDEYIDILKENSNLRKMLILLNEIEDEYLNQKIENKNSFLASIQSRIDKIADLRKISNFETSIEVAQKYKQKIDEVILNKGELTGIDTGYRYLNYYTDGLQKENLVIVGGRPGTGKTTFALNLMLNAAMKVKKPVAIFEFEMSATQLYHRLVCAQSGIDSTKLSKGKDLTADDKLCLKQTIDTLSKLKIYIDESASNTINDIKTKSRKLKQEQPDLAMIVIDHLGIISPDTSKKAKKYDSRQLEIQEYTRTLHELARELKIPIVLVCQVNRKAVDRDGPPKLSDLRESGSIEMDAELVLLLHRKEENEEYDTLKEKNKVTAGHMNPDARHEMNQNVEIKAAKAAGLSEEEIEKNKVSMMKVNIAKNRNGRAEVTCDLAYKKNIFRFEDLKPDFYTRKKEIEDEVYNND